MRWAKERSADPSAAGADPLVEQRPTHEGERIGRRMLRRPCEAERFSGIIWENCETKVEGPGGLFQYLVELRRKLLRHTVLERV